MGGNAFNLAQRIHRDYITDTITYISTQLNHPNITEDVIWQGVLGSVGKQETSGDIDVALSDTLLTERQFRDLSVLCRQHAHAVSVKTLNGGQFQTLWPIAGDPGLGYVQVDFFRGNLEFMKFSHWSPGLDVSDYKGVWNSTFIATLAKYHIDYKQQLPDDLDQVYARVGFEFSIDHGLRRVWKMRVKLDQGMRKVSPDYWETNLRFVDLPPRYDRLETQNPQDILRILLNTEDFTCVDTFEKLFAHFCDNVAETGPYPRAEYVAERFAAALVRSAEKKTYSSVDEVLQRDVFSSLDLNVLR